MCVAYRLSLRVVWLFFPQCPSVPRSRVGCLFGTVRASAVSNAHCLGGHCGARTQPDRVHPHPQDRRPGDRGVGPASRPRLGRMPAQGGRTQLASAPRQVWHLHEGLLSFHIPPVAWEAAHTPPFAAGAPTFCVVRHPFTRAVSEYTWQAKWTPYWRTCTQHGQSACPCSAPARLLRLFRARLAAPGGSRHPRREARPLGAQLLP